MHASQVFGAVLVKPSFRYHHLCRLTSEEREQYRFWSTLSNDGVVGHLYFYEIVDCWRLPVARPLAMEGRQRYTCMRLGAGQPENFIERVFEHDVTYEVPQWICVGDDDDITDVCFRMPIPYCQLWMAQKWRSLAVADVDFQRWEFIVCLTA